MEIFLMIIAIFLGIFAEPMLKYADNNGMPNWMSFLCAILIIVISLLIADILGIDLIFLIY